MENFKRHLLVATLIFNITVPAGVVSANDLPTCAAALSEPMSSVKLSTMDPAAPGANINLLNMMGQLPKHIEAYNEKKGEINLGRMLGDEWSLQMTYSLDERSPTQAFKLTKIQIIRPDGQIEELAKKPLDVFGKSFASEILNFSGSIPPQSVQVPLRIEGTTLEFLKKWGDRMEFLKADELHKLSSDKDLRRLYFRFLARDQKDLYFKRARKQYSKAVFSIALLLAWSFATSYKNKKDKHSDHSKADFAELMELFLNFDGPRFQGEAELANQWAALSREGGSPIERQVFDHLAGNGRSKLVTVSAFYKIQTIIVSQYQFKDGQVESAHGLLITEKQNPELYKAVSGWLQILDLKSVQ